DSDGDGVKGTTGKGVNSDNFEIYRGWEVTVNRALGEATDLDVFTVHSSPARRDTDADGLSDWEELNGCLDRDGKAGCDAGSEFGVSPTGTRFKAPTDPTSPDTDGDRIPDAVEIAGFGVEPLLSAPAFVRTDPTDVDTDNDGVSDSDEIVFGGNPAVPDVDTFTDTDGDGLLDRLETEGWTVSFTAVSTEHGVVGETVTCTIAAYSGCEDSAGRAQPPTSDPSLPDTDFDGLTDDLERQLGTHPRLADTDGDGISDYDEQAGTLVFPADGQTRVTDPTKADTDDDMVADGQEIKDGWLVTVENVSRPVFSDPTEVDLDGDGLFDRG